MKKTAQEMKLYWWADSTFGPKKRRELQRYCHKAYKNLKVYGYVKCHIPSSDEREYVQKYFELLKYNVDNNSTKKELFINF